MRRLDDVLARVERRLASLPVVPVGSPAGGQPVEPAACGLPSRHSCSGNWHWREDGGAGTAYERCPRAVQSRREAAAGGVPGVQTFETFDAIREPEAFRAARGWAHACEVGAAKLALLRTEDGPPNTGCGKTHLLRAAARQLARAGRWVEVLTSWGLTAAVRGRALFDAAERAAAEIAVKRWIASEVLILDDLGQEETAAQSTASFLIGVVGEREGKSLATASNLTSRELTQRYGPALVSRLLGGALVPEVQGADYRRHRSRKESA